jgi:hypothetical protein
LQFFRSGGVSMCLTLLWSGGGVDSDQSPNNTATSTATNTATSTANDHNRRVEQERWECAQELLMRTLHDVGTKSASTARYMVALLTNR